MIESRNLLHLDFENAVKEITMFIRETVEGANAKGVVAGLSGGVDSSLAVTLCVRALRKNRVLGILMPTDFTPQDDVDDAKELAQQLGIKTEYINIQEIGETFSRILKINKSLPKYRIPLANIWARIRMIMEGGDAMREKSELQKVVILPQSIVYRKLFSGEIKHSSSTVALALSQPFLCKHNDLKVKSLKF